MQGTKINLLSKKSTLRRKAAAEIGAFKLYDLGDNLYAAYLRESQKKLTWQTQVEMILALGKINYHKALVEIQSIVLANKPHDMITYAAAQSYVRLKRKSLNDAAPVIDLLKFGGLSLLDGALNPLAYDRMMPDQTQIKELISLSWDLHKHKDRLGQEKGYTDPRYGIAAACAGWDKNLVIDFLNHCLNTANSDSSLIFVTENALKGKYVKLR